jgi:ankyrin repeat protein
MKDAPVGADFESLRKQAKRWLKSIRGGDGASLSRLEKVLPKHSPVLGLREVQQALAREHGFDSWASLKEHFEITAVETKGMDALLAEFLERACIFTPPRDFAFKWRRAERIRVRHPGIAKASIHAAIVCGDLAEVERRLQEDPRAVHEKGGPQAWEPLLFACFNRLPHPPAGESSVEIAKLLLDAGADPKSYFIMEGTGWRLRFNALTGAMGRGEMGQPEHPRADELARLLLDRGADPNDSQGLYNTHLKYVGDDTKWLDLLFQYGLSKNDEVNWHPEKRDPHGLKILDYLVASAAKHGHTRRLECLLAHGADSNARSIYNDKTAYVNALLAGKLDVASILARHGAERIALDGYDAFIAACARVDRDEASRLLEGHPEYLESIDPLIDSATEGNARVVKLMLELGMDPNGTGKHGHRALNNACKNRKIAEILLDHGADPRERCFGGTPARWAQLDGASIEMARYFASKSRYIFDAVVSGDVALTKDLLEKNPELAVERNVFGNTPLHELPTEPEEARPIIEMLLALGADPHAKNDAGQTPAQKLEAEALDEIADLLDGAIVHDG